jgi:hypothetical protein
MLCLIVVSLPSNKNQFVVQLNNKSFDTLREELGEILFWSKWYGAITVLWEADNWMGK